MGERTQTRLRRADVGRIAGFIDEIALVGADERGGWTRPAFTSVERSAHVVFARRAREIGARIRIDAIGNTWAEFLGFGAPIVIGSHLDTVPQGGRFDGVAGVAAALEVAHILKSADVQGIPLTAVAFAAEEGARFGAACLGSRVVTGALDPDALRSLMDVDGRSAWECATAIGLRPDRGHTARVMPESVRAFFELHVEQARSLEQRGGDLGVVGSIAGSVRLEIVFGGRPDHSGATPMNLRVDALAGASELVLALEADAQANIPAVATVGRIDVSPGSVTTVPGEARLLVDLRAASAAGQARLARFAEDAVRRIADSRSLTASVQTLAAQQPVSLDATLCNRLASALEKLNIPYASMSSGASHDAAQMASVAPTAMLFIPSRDGASHSPAEWSDPADIARGADAIAAAILSLDD